jgi:class 3 adenylate cyclase
LNQIKSISITISISISVSVSVSVSVSISVSVSVSVSSQSQETKAITTTMVPDINKNVNDNVTSVDNVDNIINEEASITIGMGDDDDDDDDDDEWEVDVTSITNSNHYNNNHPFFDSFVSVGVSVMKDDDGDDGDDDDNHDDDDHSKTPSMKSIGDVSNINNDNDNGGTTSITTLNSFKERSIVRYVFFGLLVLIAILVVVMIATTTSTRTNNGRTGIIIVAAAATMILILIGCIGIVFIIYENLLKNREKMLVKSNRRSEAIVDSLFPSIVRDRILEEGGLVNNTNNKLANTNVNNNGNNDGNPTNRRNSEKLPSSSLPPPPPPPPSPLPSSPKNSISSSTASSKPIADYFPSASILFADIVGFTSWASIRDPAQVFILLETVYGRFDDIAKKKGVFKVETIGDCYVAATGLPVARTDHAIVMASFARRCLENMLDLLESRELENELGIGTNDLGMRFGIHSGSVIGGVLRGAKSRYQLFGDTINTASRIESSSMKNKIHLSEQTAELLIAGGKKSWVEGRDEKIHAKVRYTTRHD